MKNLTPLMTVAVSKAIAEKAVKAIRPKVNPGTHSIDVTVRIVGTLDVGQPFEQTFAGAVPWEAIATLALDKLNDASVKAILAEVQDAKDAGTLAALIDETKARTEALVSGLKAETKQTCNGKVTSRLAVERV